MNLSDPIQLQTTLLSLSANNTATIRAGENALKPFLKTPACLPALINQVC